MEPQAQNYPLDSSALYHTVCIFHNRNPSNLDSSDQQIRLCCDLNLNLDYESNGFRFIGLPKILCKIMVATCAGHFNVWEIFITL